MIGNTDLLLLILPDMPIFTETERTFADPGLCHNLL